MAPKETIVEISIGDILQGILDLALTLVQIVFFTLGSAVLVLCYRLLQDKLKHRLP